MRAILSLFSFYGRSRRTSYGIYFAITIVAYFLVGIPFFLFSVQREPSTLQAQMKAVEQKNPAAAHMFDWIFRIPHEYVVAGLVAAGVLLAILYVVWVALTVRRLHDMNATGWLVIIAILVALVPYLGYLLVILVLGLWPGTKGANGYGPDPRRPDAVPGRDGFSRPA